MSASSHPPTRWVFPTLLVLLAANVADATIRYGPIQIAGNLQSQNIVRHVDATTHQFIQTRNVARVQLRYEWLEAGRLLGRVDVPFVRDSRVFLLWRGVYDGVYDATPDVAARADVHGRAYGGQTLPEVARSLGRANVLQLSSLSRGARDRLRFENDLREVYVDLRLRDVPLSIRAGKQQIVWGEADNFRMLDRINPLDLTWHQAQELPPPAFGWDEIRRPLWMLKFLYEIGNVGPLSQAFVEWYWNPGDWKPAKIAFLPRPWGLPLLDPLTNPIDGAFVRGVCERAPDQRCTRLLHGTKLFQRGDYDRDPFDNSQVGVRVHAMTPQRVEFTVNYLYQRWAGDDGTNSAPLRGLPLTGANTRRASRLLRRGVFPAEYFTPYVHTFGLSLNYSDDRHTQTLYRLETIYDLGIPFFDVAEATVIDVPALPGVTRKEMWKGMIGFDRPTWIRHLNPRGTVFLTGQLFWHHLVDNPGCNAQRVSFRPADRRGRGGSCLVGALDLPSTRRLGTKAAADLGSPAYRDKIRDWEVLLTMAAFTFYRGGSILPTVAVAVDPVNQWSMEALWSLNYTVNDVLTLTLAQKYFITPKGHSTPIFETWALGGLNNGRSETTVRVTIQY